MITAEQYNKLLPYRDQLLLFEVRRSWDAGDMIYTIHEQIFGRKVNTSCNSCKAEAVTELFFALKNYEDITKS